ncbi:DUF2726 domain-containing protein [Aerococcus viridans]
MKKLSTEEVQEQINKVHGDNAYVLLEEYKNRREKVLTKHILCGNEWLSNTGDLANGHGCPYCANNRISTTETYKERVKNLVGDEYSVLSEYKRIHDKVTFEHHECGHIFQMEANAFMQGQRCPNCRYNRTAKSNRIPLEDAQKMIKEATDGEYEIIGNYKGLNPRNGAKSDIKHVSCGYVFKMQPGRIIRTETGCPNCSSSYGEKFVESYLKENNFTYKTQYRIKECRNKRPLPFDFAIFENDKLIHLIEYDGEQHFKPKFGKKYFEKTIHNDNIKNEFCSKNEINLIRIPYKRTYQRSNLKEYVYDTLDNMLIPSQA